MKDLCQGSPLSNNSSTKGQKKEKKLSGGFLSLSRGNQPLRPRPNCSFYSAPSRGLYAASASSNENLLPSTCLLGFFEFQMAVVSSSFYALLLRGLLAFDSRMAHSHVKNVKGRRKARTKRKVSPMKASKPSTSWACFVRANYCSPAMIRGCYRIERILGE